MGLPKVMYHDGDTSLGGQDLRDSGGCATSSDDVSLSCKLRRSRCSLSGLAFLRWQ